MGEYEDQLHYLQENYPLVPHTGVGRLFSTVRRMKAEKRIGLPIHLRTGFVISVDYSKPANELDEAQWEQFYRQLCEELKEKYPDFYGRVFKKS